MTEPAATTDDTQVISAELRALLVCPIDKAALNLEGPTLVCAHCGRVYPIENGIPNMLIETKK